MVQEEIYVCNQLYSLPLADLEPDPDQPRKYFDPAALEELAASIARNNVMTPIFFRIDAGRKVIVAGERRCAAAGKAGVERVPAIYVDVPNYTEISLIENMVRSDLNPVEEAEALDRLMKEHEYTQANLCEVLSKSQPYISETLSLNGLPAEIRDECRQNPAIPKKTLLTIARKQSMEEMLKAYQKYKDSLSAAKKSHPGWDGRKGPRYLQRSEYGHQKDRRLGCKDLHEGGAAESASFPAKDERGRREGHHYRGGVRGRGLIAAAVLRGSVISKWRNRQNGCNRHICCLNAYFRLFDSHIN
ncbi:MAG: ParB family transcriptional regulator, chromosome partitioning protein [Thermodesulfobacteriota bacterium]|nr:ParB family transcriptional regulator, chromosome partitioning protein [Thermodesulfobacteriota bacterium]